MYILVYSKVLLNFIKIHPFISALLIVAIIVVMAGILLFYIIVGQDYSSKNRILMTIYEWKYNINSSNGRDVLYSIALNLFQDNWLWGLGWMNFSKYAGLSGITMVRNVHNIYIQIMLECGVIFGVIFLICMALLVFRCLKVAKKRVISGAGGAMLLYLLLGGITDNTVYYPYFWIIFGISLYTSSILNSGDASQGLCLDFQRKVPLNSEFYVGNGKGIKENDFKKMKQNN